MQWRKEGSLMSVVISLIWKPPPTTSCFSILFFLDWMQTFDIDIRYMTGATAPTTPLPTLHLQYLL